MALPKLDTPTYRLTLPSTGEEIQYRPFLVKEQKLLMMAQESEEDQQIVDAVTSLVRTCTFDKVDANEGKINDYHTRHEDSHLEIYCDNHPDSLECRVYDD